MKRLTAILMVSILMMTLLTGCGKNRLLYKNVNLEDYVDVEGYLGIEIDTASSEYKEYYDLILYSDVYNYNLYKELTEGVVEDGDIVNLDYEGKLDGVAFEGGTATGATLEIGSGTFIDDFEEELIGVAVGETKDVTATFPSSYTNNPDLAGKEAIFTCKINSINRAMTEQEAYSEMGFASVDEYITDIKDRAIEQYILEKVCDSAKIEDYPEKDRELLGEAIFEYSVDFYKTNYQQDFESLLQYNGLTADEFKEDTSIEIMNTNMVMYYILDAEELEIYESTVNSQGVDQPIIAESYAVQDIVIEYLCENAKIK